ncbi:MAG TPA: TetR/AcrR family transcriptional regulator [Spirochaetota bacterium]|nr:TetR/AcrR family transcriptional regulator [Spirochaetota bacterium]
MKTKNKAIEERIFKSTEILIIRNGVKGWNMNDLAAHAGITKRTLYRFIDSKEQMIRETVFRNIFEIRDEVFEILQAGDDVLTAIDKIISRITELMRGNILSRYGDILNEYPEIESGIVSENEIFFTQLREFLSRGIEEGYFVKELTPDFMYRTFLAILFYFFKYSESREEAADSIALALRCMFRGSINYDKSGKFNIG